MIKSEVGIFGTTTITCDKCKRTATAPNSCYNDIFFSDGWALHRGRKYEHLCNSCLTPKARKAMAWAKEKFM